MAVLDYVFNKAEPIKFPRKPYWDVRDRLKAGNYWFTPSKFTADIEKYTNAIPAAEVAPPDFPIAIYTDPLLMKEIYEHSFDRDSAAIDPIYAQEFLNEFERRDVCTDLVDKIAFAKITVISGVRAFKEDVFPESVSPGFPTGSPVEDGFREGGLEGWQTFSRQQGLVFRAGDDAETMIGKYGCKSQIVKRFLENLKDWIALMPGK